MAQIFTFRDNYLYKNDREHLKPDDCFTYTLNNALQKCKFYLPRGNDILYSLYLNGKWDDNGRKYYRVTLSDTLDIKKIDCSDPVSHYETVLHPVPSVPVPSVLAPAPSVPAAALAAPALVAPALAAQIPEEDQPY
jgi:hypothetical protein